MREFTVRQRGGSLVHRVTLGKKPKCLGAQKSRERRLARRVEMVTRKPKPQLVAGAGCGSTLAGGAAELRD